MFTEAPIQLLMISVLTAFSNSSYPPIHCIDIYILFQLMRLVNSEGFNQKDADIFSRYKEKTFPGHKRMPTSLAWNADGKYLVTAQKYLRLWQFNEVYGLERIGNDIKGHDSFIDDLKFYDRNLFATVSRDYLKFWDIRQGINKSIKQQQKKNKEDFISIAWHHGEKPSYTILTKDNSLTMYDFREGGNPISLRTVKANFQVIDLVWDNTDSILICGGLESNRGVLNIFTNQLQLLPQTMEVHSMKINSVALDRVNKTLATCSDDSLVHIYQFPDIACSRAYSFSEQAYKKLSFNHNGQYLAASSTQALIDIFNIQKGGLAYRIKTSTIQENMQWHPNKQILAIIDEDDKRKGIGDKTEENVKLFMPEKSFK